jgi:ZIP family zinc transporter
MGIILGLSLLAGLATLVGAIAVLAFDKPSEKVLAVFLGLAAGIMLGVVVMDLIPSALSEGSVLTTIMGVIAGIVLLKILSSTLNAIYCHKSSLSNTSYLRKMGYLIAIGIALHDLPEGIAIAAGFSATTQLGWMLAVAIGLHNIPEGIALAAPLWMSGLKPFRIILIAAFVTIFTPIGTFLGLLLVNLSPSLIAFLLALAGGAMVYIVFKEIIPEAKANYPIFALRGAFLGMIIIMILTMLE